MCSCNYTVNEKVHKKGETEICCIKNPIKL